MIADSSPNTPAGPSLTVDDAFIARTFLAIRQLARLRASEREKPPLAPDEAWLDPRPSDLLDHHTAIHPVRPHAHSSPGRARRCGGEGSGPGATWSSLTDSALRCSLTLRRARFNFRQVRTISMTAPTLHLSDRRCVRVAPTGVRV